MNEILDPEQVPEPPRPPSPTLPSPYDVVDDFSIFPPSKHEGLHVQEEFQSKPPDRPLPSSDFRLEVVAGESAKDRVLLGFQSLCSKSLLLLRSSAPSISSQGVFWSFPAAAATGVVGVLFLWWLRRRRVGSALNEEILLLFRENQKKLDKLLHEIAQMKEIMSVQHKVPIRRSA